MEFGQWNQILKEVLINYIWCKIIIFLKKLMFLKFQKIIQFMKNYMFEIKKVFIG
jgi:hypothetical protein